MEPQLLPLPPSERTSVRSRINAVNAVNPSTPLINVNGITALSDPEQDHSSRSLTSQSFNGNRVTLPDDFEPGIRRRPTLPISSNVPTPQASDDEEDDTGHNLTKSDSLESADSSSSTNLSRPNNFVYSRSEDKLFSEKTLEVLKKLKDLVGLDNVKDHFKELGMYMHNNKVLSLDSHDERYHALFQGNPGTGKTTVAKLYADFLKSMDILKSNYVIENSGAKLASQGADYISRVFKSKDGGVLFVDEAYQLVAPHSGVGGKQVLDIILDEMDKEPPRWIVIFAGYKEEFEPFFAHNDGLSSRISQVLTFEDFPKDQLQDILWGLFQKRFSRHHDGLKIEGGRRGPFLSAAVGRIFQGHGRRGFGNARTVRGHFQRICQRQARRVGQIDNPTMKDRLFFTKEDLLGPRPLNVKATSKNWSKLKSLVGLHEVKNSVEIMFKILDTNYQRELKGKTPHAHSLNRVFVGSPGTGKTTVAKLYGKILAELGFLSKGDVVIKTPADFIGNAVGMSESNTRAILASTLGKVLIIDEAYMLDPGDGTTTGTRDSYKTAVLDSIVAEVQGNPGDDRCVLLLGYEDKMESLFQNGNPGLPGRFMADMPFRFADFSAEELEKILKDDLKARQIKYEHACLKAATDLLSLYKYNPNFSNAREVKILVSEAVFRNQQRCMAGQEHDQDFDARLEPEDFDPWSSPHASSTGHLVNCRADLTDIVSEPVIEQLERYFPSSFNRDLNRHIPRTFVFKGPPGTGKMTLAKYMGKVYRDMGMLPTPTCVPCQAANFIGQHVGQTIPKTRMQLAKGLGKVLIIRDIHRIARGGYSNEALDELIAFVRTYAGRMAIVLTGPSEAVDELLADRHELGTLFPDRITFDNLSPRDSMKLLDRLIHDVEPSGETPFFVSQAATERFEKATSILCMFEGWGNASLATVLKTRMILKGDAERYLVNAQDPGNKHRWKITEGTAMSCFRDLFHEIRNSGAVVRKTISDPSSHAPSGETHDNPPESTSDPSATAPSQAMSEAISEPKQVVHATRQIENPSQEMAKPTGDQSTEEKSKQPSRMEEQNKIKDKTQKADQAKKMSVEEALKQIGKCAQGYNWDKIAGGYQCQGGSHFVSDAEVAAAIR